jgi:hypothetical protein
MSDMQSLIRDLQSNNPDKRYAACEVLRAMVLHQPLPQEAIDVLNSATNDRNHAVADSAQRALDLHTQISNALEQSEEPSKPITNAVAHWPLIGLVARHPTYHACSFLSHLV